MRRAAISIPANIAEGCCHGGRPTFARHLRIALGSAGELEYYAILAGDLKLLFAPATAALVAKASEVKRILTGLLIVVSRVSTEN
jgi:four helix bundle protein